MDTLTKSHRARRGVFRKSVWALIWILALLSGLYAPALAQTSSPRFTHLNSEQGLSNDMVRCILQDSQGFMWFGTQDGLNKYDGYTFTVYRHLRSDPNSLSNSTITALHQDRSGTLWIGTTVGLDSFSGGAAQFTHYPDVQEEISVIYEDATGLLWIGTYGSGLFQYDRTNQQFIQYMPDPDDPHSLSDDAVVSIYEDSSGMLWMGTADGGLDAFDPVTQTFTHYRNDPADPHSLSYGRVTTIYEDRSGAFWIGTGFPYDVEVGGLNIFNRDSKQFAHYRHDPLNRHSLSNNHVRSIYEDQTRALWIGTDDGLNVLDRSTNTFTSFHHDPLNPHSLSGDIITTIYEDRTGTLWFGTDGAGINKYTRVKEKFARYQPDPLDPNSLSGPVVGAITQDRDGVLWIGVAGEGLDSLDRATGQFDNYSHDPNDPSSLSNNNARALHVDHEGTLWVGTNRGLDRLDSSLEGGTFTRYVHNPDDPASLGPGAVKAILEDHTNTLWIGTEEPASLSKFDRTSETFTRYEHDPDNPDSFINTFGIRAIYEDRDGDLWIGTYDGLVHFDRETKKFTRYEHDPDDPYSLSRDFVWDIYQDSVGILWIATSGGLNHFDQTTEQFAVYTMEDGLANDNVMCILTDKEGYLWLGTDGGLSKFDPQTETFKNYDESDGLASNVVMLAACHQNESGEMFIGTLNGFNVFHPADVKDNPHIPPLVLTAFRKFDEVVEFDTPLSAVKEITLSYQDNFFAFEFAALDYTDPAKNQYAYMLEGFDKNWIYCGTRRYASYTNLPPGEYTFRVKGANNDGVWNEAGHAVTVTITPPFWATWWFRGLAAAVVLGTVAVIVRARMRSIAVLRASEERFRTLFENAPLCVFELDMTQAAPRIMHANQCSERVYGWSVEEFAIASLDTIFAPATRPALERALSNLSAGETITIESTGLRRDGTEFPVRASATGLALSANRRFAVEGRPGSDLKRAILAIEDITAEKSRRSEEEAITEERRRIAREIHDGLAQDLAGLRFEVGLWHKLVDDDPARMHAELDSLRKLLDDNIREVRRSIFALRPVALEELGFYPALHQFIEEFGEQNQLHIDLHITGPQERLPTFLEPVLFRIVQESLNNAGKHAQAQMVWVTLELESSNAVKLSVRDDGAGFDPAILDQAVRRGHLGLKQMRERVENLNGTFELHSQPGSGTEIYVVLPLGGG